MLHNIGMISHEQLAAAVGSPRVMLIIVRSVANDPATQLDPNGLTNTTANGRGQLGWEPELRACCHDGVVVRCGESAIPAIIAIFVTAVYLLPGR